jgi:hypothetical protein
MVEGSALEGEVSIAGYWHQKESDSVIAAIGLEIFLFLFPIVLTVITRCK